MRIAFVWTGLTSYMADAWRRLAAAPGVELRVWIDSSSAAAKAVAFDAETLMAGVECEIVDFEATATRQREGVADCVVAWKPDVLFVVGWRSILCRLVVLDARLKDVPKVCCFDMPWRWKLRCLVAPLVLGRFLRHYNAAFVPGVVCARYAKWLGFKQIYKGLFAIDTKKFHRTPSPSSSPSPYFLYIGRDSSEKRLGDLRRAYAIYREQGGKLELRLYGKGLEGGFVTPKDVPALLHGAAAFVLASEFDPWPLVLLEAMSAGCPVIASDRCTNRPELGKNWHVFRCGDVQSLARELLGAESRLREGDAGGTNCERAREDLALARQYDCSEWVGRVGRIVDALV